MLRGYFTLTGTPSLSTFDSAPYYDTLIQTKQKGELFLDTDLATHGFDIPSRDKQVLMFGDYCDEMSTVDSMFPELPYQQKLIQLGLGQNPGFILNRTSHGSIAILGCAFHYGLFDLKTQSAYYLFSTESSTLENCLAAEPLRYLLYRFPRSPVVFIQAEGVCSKWWRWMKTHQSPLHAFNALEHKLHGPPKA
jgi:hypothetical protein